MSTVLALTSSALGTQSVSNRLVAHALDRFRASEPGAHVLVRDLGSDHIPHIDGEVVAALRGGASETAGQARALALSEALLEELVAADVLVIGAPMYNFGISTTLKAWFDYVLRAGITFRYSEAGPEGLLKGKRALVILSRGGLYSEGPARAMDFQEPHILALLRFMGIDDVAVVRAEGLGFGPEARDTAIAGAEAEIEQAFAGVWREAA